MNRTDIELIEAHRRGETSAAGILVARHLVQVKGLLFQLVMDHDQAEELTQEVFCRVLTKLEQFRGTAAFSTWLYRIAVNAARQAARREGVRRKERSRHSANIDGIDTPPEAELIRKEEYERVHHALAQLSLPLRAAVVLTTIQGLSAGEAASIEGCPIGTMYWRIHEARRLLRSELKGLIG